jgi:FKBP-type peptidyl-prolyl cis-trans isomerase FkpA
MKQAIFTLLLFSVIGLLSCRKSTLQPAIAQVDQQNILSYISIHGITGMKRDTTGGDTSGIYYETILPGKAGTSYQYSDSLSFVFTLSTFDGNYTSLDTTINHYASLAGHITLAALPYGLQLAVHDVLKRGGSMRVLIPSRLAYGISGYGTGSSQNVNTRIAGNQCLDYYIHAIDNEAAYDNQVIVNYMAANGLSGYKQTASGLWYQINTPGTGTDLITNNTTITSTYTAYELNSTIFSQYNSADGSGTSLDIPDLIPGVQEGLKNYATTGTYISLFIPSTLAYGKIGISGTLPPNSIVHYEMKIVSVSP